MRDRVNRVLTISIHKRKATFKNTNGEFIILNHYRELNL